MVPKRGNKMRDQAGSGHPKEFNDSVGVHQRSVFTLFAFNSVRYNV